ncbi:MAG: hypothetical protein NT098_05325 [Candidatus Parcubacteria bacterium]|nr:hypothetical protein [Candidatus Parcubacteria bacterium]
MNEDTPVICNSFSFLPLRVALYKKYWEMSQKRKATNSEVLYKQKMELMTYRDGFREEVGVFRKHFGIPSNGFPDFKPCEEWAKEITVNSEPSQMVTRDPLRDYPKAENETLFESDYEKDLSRLLKMFEISDRWSGAVEYYLLFNNIDAMEILPKKVIIKMLTDEKTHKPTLCLQITADTEQVDIKEWWRTVQKFQGILRSFEDLDYSDDAREFVKKLNVNPLPYIEKQEKKKDRKRLPYVFEKYKTAYFLHQSGKSYNEIKKECNCEQSEVGKFIERFKKMIQRNKLD